MEALQQNRVKGRRLLLGALGYATSDVIHKPKVFNDGECTICLKRLDKDGCGTSGRSPSGRSPSGRLTLPCGHVFHGECICQWANFKNENLTLDAIFPTRGRRISYFKQGQNIFSCPTCRDEITRDVFDKVKIKKVIARVHALYKKIAVRWAYYTEALNKLWRAGHTDVWAVKEEGGNFLLKSDYKQFDRITKDGKKNK